MAPKTRSMAKKPSTTDYALFMQLASTDLRAALAMIPASVSVQFIAADMDHEANILLNGESVADLVTKSKVHTLELPSESFEVKLHGFSGTWNAKDCSEWYCALNAEGFMDITMDNTPIVIKAAVEVRSLFIMGDEDDEEIEDIGEDYVQVQWGESELTDGQKEEVQGAILRFVRFNKETVCVCDHNLEVC